MLLPVRRSPNDKGTTMADRAAVADTVLPLIERFNKKGVTVDDDTMFASDLEWDSLTVMDFVAEVEDAFDIIISMNMQAEIETVGQLLDAVTKLTDA
jgi:acyl carrier protein